MLVMAGGNVQKSFAAVLDNNEDIQNEINQTEEYIDYLNKEISFYISHIMVFTLEEEDAVTMSALFKITGNIERMGDHATNIAGYANLLEDKGLRLSDKAQAEVREMMKITEEAYATLIGTKPNSVHIRMAQIEQKIDDMTDDYREHQLERLKSGVCSGEACVVYSEMLTDFERLGDHMLNVAEAAAESNVKSFGIEAVKVKAEPAESTATA
jgi:phosphate:Na+ symporter